MVYVYISININGVNYCTCKYALRRNKPLCDWFRIFFFFSEDTLLFINIVVFNTYTYLQVSFTYKIHMQPATKKNYSIYHMRHHFFSSCDFVVIKCAYVAPQGKLDSREKQAVVNFEAMRFQYIAQTEAHQTVVTRAPTSSATRGFSSSGAMEM